MLGSVFFSSDEFRESPRIEAFPVVSPGQVLWVVALNNLFLLNSPLMLACTASCKSVINKRAESELSGDSSTRSKLESSEQKTSKPVAVYQLVQPGRKHID